MKRRQFLGTSAALACALTRSRRLLALGTDNQYRNEIGIQLYTLRNEIDADVEGTIKAVAEAGYKQVEPYGFSTAGAMIQVANDNGMAVNSSHFEWDAVINPDKKGVPPFAEILTKANEAGLSHLVIPYLADSDRETLDDYRQLADRCNQGAEQAKEAGIQLAYHNHAFEFQPMEGGKTGYDVMIQRFSAEMHFEVDVFWIQVAGKDPVELIRGLKGRVSQLHLKDLNESIATPNYGSIPKDAFEELGDGVISMEPIIEVATEAGVKLCHVEQDHSPHPLKSIRQSIDYLKTL